MSGFFREDPMGLYGCSLFKEMLSEEMVASDSCDMVASVLLMKVCMRLLFKGCLGILLLSKFIIICLPKLSIISLGCFYTLVRNNFPILSVVGYF